MWRGAVRGRPKPIVVVAVWLLCLPAALGSVGILWWGVTTAGSIIKAGALLNGVLFIIILYKVTKNFLTLPKPKLDE